MGPNGLMTAKCLVEVCVSIGDAKRSTMCARSVATGHQKQGGWCECGHVLNTEGERHVLRSCTWKRRGREQRGGLFITHCLQICPKRFTQKIQIWPHLSQRSQPSPRKQWQFQENSLMKHFRPCGELAAGVRQQGRPSADVTREEYFGGKSGGAEVEVRREVSRAELAQAQSCVVRDSISPTDGHRR